MQGSCSARDVPKRQIEDDADAMWAPVFRAVLDAVADAIVVADAGGHILLVNEEVERMFGLPAAQLIGQTVEVLIPEAVRDAHVGHRRLFAEAPHRRRMGQALMLAGRRADGSEFPIDVSLFPVGHSQNFRVIAAIRDATTQRLAERAVWQSRDLAEQLARAQKLEAIGRLAGGVAHDFNNLLQVIGGHADTLLASAQDDAARRLLFGIRHATERAASLTRQLLAFGRRQMLRPQIVDLNSVVRGLEGMLTRVIGEDIKLVVRLDNALKSVEVDPGQVEQVVLNLAVNARDAMAGVGGTLEIETRNLDLAQPVTYPRLPVEVPPGSWVLLSVRDTGSGMGPETAARAFEPFFTTKDAREGSGLGLSMVYGIVKQSGGYTWLDSAVGVGTRVSIILPVVCGLAEPHITEAVPQAAALVGAGIILLVEDEEQVRELLASYLGEAGYTVIAAADGRKALSLFEAGRDQINLIVSDVVMPHMGGLALARAARAIRPDIGILYLSGYVDKQEQGADLDLTTAYLQKPFTRADLLARVAELLNSSRR